MKLLDVSLSLSPCLSVCPCLSVYLSLCLSPCLSPSLSLSTHTAQWRNSHLIWTPWSRFLRRERLCVDFISFVQDCSALCISLPLSLCLPLSVSFSVYLFISFHYFPLPSLNLLSSTLLSLPLYISFYLLLSFFLIVCDLFFLILSLSSSLSIINFHIYPPRPCITHIHTTLHQIQHLLLRWILQLMFL